MPKKIVITFNNPLDEADIDHLEVWWKLGIGGTYAQLGSDIPFVSGAEDYLIEDLGPDVTDGNTLYYEARSYDVSGNYTGIANYIQVSSGSIDLYEPTWLANFDIREQDANGYTIFAPSVDSKIMYVDATLGNDTTAIPYAHDSFADPFLPTSELSYATFNAAYAELRDGFPDWILFKKGEEWLNINQSISLSGRGLDEPMLLGAYGSGTVRPLLKTDVTHTTYVFRIWGSRTDLTFFGLDFYNYQSDPNNIDYSYVDNGKSSGIVSYAAGAIRMRNILVEDCRTRYMAIGVSFVVGGDARIDTTNSNIQVRKNVIHNNLDSTAHAQGMWLEYNNVLVEDNILSHNGWGMAVPPVPEALAVALTGVVTSITVDVIPVDAPDACYLKVTTDAAVPVYVKYTSFVGNTYTIESTDFTADNASIGNYAGVTLPRATIFNHNIYSSGVMGSIYRNNISLAPSSIHFKFTANCDKPDDDASTLNVALIGVAETSVSVNNPPADSHIPATGNITITLDSTVTRNVAYTAYLAGVYTIASTDFSVDNASLSNGVQNESVLNYIISDNVSMYGNLFIEGELITSYGGNDTNNNGERFLDFRFQGNASQYIGRTQPTNRTLAYGTEAWDVDNTLIEDNLYLETDNPLVTSGQCVRFVDYISNSISRNNKEYKYNGSGGGFASGESANQVNNSVHHNTSDLDDSLYVDPTRTVETYMTSLGQIATTDEFAKKCIATGKDNPDSNYTAEEVVGYLKAGYEYVNDVFFVTDLAATADAFTKDTPYTTTVEVYSVSEDPVTYAWYVDSVLDVTNTTATFSKATPDAGSFTVYCVATSNAVSATSATSTVSVTVAPLELTLSVASDNYLQLTGGDVINMTPGDTLSFSLKRDVWGLYQSPANGTVLRVETTTANNMYLRGGTVLVNGANILDNTAMPEPDADGWWHYVFTADTNTTASHFGKRTDLAKTTEGVLKDLVFTISGSTTTFLVDSGAVDGETEESVEGGSFMTFHNVVAGDWS